MSHNWDPTFCGINYASKAAILGFLDKTDFDNVSWTCKVWMQACATKQPPLNKVQVIYRKNEITIQGDRHDQELKKLKTHPVTFLRYTDTSSTRRPRCKCAGTKDVTTVDKTYMEEAAECIINLLGSFRVRALRFEDFDLASLEKFAVILVAQLRRWRLRCQSLFVENGTVESFENLAQAFHAYNYRNRTVIANGIIDNNLIIIDPPTLTSQHLMNCKGILDIETLALSRHVAMRFKGTHLRIKNSSELDIGVLRLYIDEFLDDTSVMKEFTLSALGVGWLELEEFCLGVPGKCITSESHLYWRQVGTFHKKLTSKKGRVADFDMFVTNTTNMKEKTCKVVFKLQENV